MQFDLDLLLQAANDTMHCYIFVINNDATIYIVLLLYYILLNLFEYIIIKILILNYILILLLTVNGQQLSMDKVNHVMYFCQSKLLDSERVIFTCIP